MLIFEAIETIYYSNFGNWYEKPIV